MNKIIDVEKQDDKITMAERKYVGGNYFHIKKKNKIITSVLIRDCHNQGVNCDFELIQIKDGVVNGGPVLGDEWITEALYDMWLEEGETEMTIEDFDKGQHLMSGSE